MNNDLISRASLKKAFKEAYEGITFSLIECNDLIDNAPEVKSYTLEDLEKAKNNGYKWGKIDGKKERSQGKWIPVSERLPNDLEPVNITWINHGPESYYKEIKDIPFTATGVYFNGQWYWWSTLCTDTLAEYSHNFDDVIDDDIEITAWQPLPEPYQKGGAENEDSK